MQLILYKANVTKNARGSLMLGSWSNKKELSLLRRPQVKFDDEVLIQLNYKAHKSDQIQPLSGLKDVKRWSTQYTESWLNTTYNSSVIMTLRIQKLVDESINYVHGTKSWNAVGVGLQVCKVQVSNPHNLNVLNFNISRLLVLVDEKSSWL